MSTRHIDLMNEPTLSTELNDKFKSGWLSAPGRIWSYFSVALSSIFFVPSYWASSLFLLVFIHDLRHLVFFMGGVAIAYLAARALGLADDARKLTIVSVNAGLASLATAWLTGPSDLPIVWQAGALFFVAASTAFAAAATLGAFGTSRLPPMVIGYGLVAGSMFTLLPDLVAAAANATPTLGPVETIDEWVVTFFQSLGAVVYSPNAIVGLIIASVIAIWSPAMLLLGAIGWAAGVLTALGLESEGVDYLYLLSAHNYFFAGAAVGAVCFFPGRWSPFIAIAAGSVAAILAALTQYLFGGSGFAFLPLPSMFTVWLVHWALAVKIDKGDVRINDQSATSPEEAAWRAVYWQQRAGYPNPFIGVPVAGTVRIAQGFNGKISHKGLWQHAFDLQRPDSDDFVLEETGGYVRSTWGTPVFSPTSGIVEIASDSAPDNRMGVSNYADNWGNYVVIRQDTGGWLLLGHFRHGSLAVRPGSRVVEGDYIGEIGNSGRSPFPHLHMQMQKGREPGSPTVPFRLANYLMRSTGDSRGEVWVASGIPEEGTLLRVATRNPPVHALLSSASPGTAVWHVERKGRIPGRFKGRAKSVTEKIEIALDEAGRHVFSDRLGNYVVVSIDYDAWRIVESKPGHSAVLRSLAMCSVAIPHAAQPDLTWEEPVLLLPEGPGRQWQLLSAPFRGYHFVRSKSRCRVAPGGERRHLEIETTFDRIGDGYPVAIESTFELLRGPSQFILTFKAGSLTLSLQSFTPRFSIHLYN
jgi:hypothetical protein